MPRRVHDLEALVADLDRIPVREHAIRRRTRGLRVSSATAISTRSSRCRRSHERTEPAVDLVSHDRPPAVRRKELGLHLVQREPCAECVRIRSARP